MDERGTSWPKPFFPPEVGSGVDAEVDMKAKAPWDARSEEQGGVTRRGRPARRPKTMSRREMMREARRRERAGDSVEIMEYNRPRARSECVNGPRPCLFVSCKHHLYLDVNPETGSVKLNFPDKEVWELEETCALDIAERGGITLEEVGEILNLTRERIRQLEVDALNKMKDEGGKHELDEFVGWDPHRGDLEP
jgi:hypothetical protein